MDLATMRDEFKASTSGFADDLTDSAIEERLNRFYRYVLPADVDGALSEIIWIGTTNTSLNFVAIPGYVTSLNQPKVWFSDGADKDFIAVWTDLAEFTRAHPNGDTVSGKPTAACFYGRAALFFNVIPDAVYTFNVQCRGGSSADLAATGLDDEIHSLCIVHGAAWHFLLSVEDESGAAREGGQYEIFKSMLHTRSTSSYKARTPARSF